MKTHMTSHVDSMVEKMYPDATATVWKHLEAMFKDVSEELEEEKDAIYDSMYQDYMNVLCGTQIDEMMPKWERTMRGSIAEEVAKTDALFQKLLDGESRDAILGKTKDDVVIEEAKEVRRVVRVRRRLGLRRRNLRTGLSRRRVHMTLS